MKVHTSLNLYGVEGRGGFLQHKLFIPMCLLLRARKRLISILSILFVQRLGFEWSSETSAVQTDIKIDRHQDANDYFIQIYLDIAFINSLTSNIFSGPLDLPFLKTNV